MTRPTRAQRSARARILAFIRERGVAFIAAEGVFAGSGSHRGKIVP